MQRTSVSSSNIAAIGYDAKQQVLEVEFLNGSVYQYSGIPESLYIGLMNAASHGSYFDNHIKKVGFAYQKIS
jgi:KTSC domain